MRRQFQLPRMDEDFLAARNLPWEAVVEGSTQWVVLHEFLLPPGYNVGKASVAVQIVAGYPVSPLDMAYFDPHLSRADGKAIAALSPHAFDGKQWQRWSRHRTDANPWTPDEDNFGTHVAYVETWLQDELKKNK